MARLREQGFNLKLGSHLYDQRGYLAGTDKLRAADFNTMFADPEVDAVLCACGGYGAVRILDYVDWSVVAANPKLFIGFSDITTMHLAIERHVNMVTIHGPMLTAHGRGFSKPADDCFWKVVGNAEPYGELPGLGADVHTLVGGYAEGRLAGGCLALLSAAVGTPESPNFDGKIVIIEDIGERAYRVDRLLMQLLRAGTLDSAAGFVIGTVTDWDTGESDSPAITLDDVWRDYIVPLGKPAITGFPCGHIADSLTLPLGCLAKLDAGAGTLTLLESAVS